jgi:hypothetical protein
LAVHRGFGRRGLFDAEQRKESAVKKFLAAAVLAAVAMPSASAWADPPPWAPAHGKRAKDRALYDSYGRYYEPRRLSRDDRVWRGDDGRYHCRRDNGTTGLIIGAAAGALLGRELDGGRDRTVGTIIGAAGGGLLGRAIDRGELKCR